MCIIVLLFSFQYNMYVDAYIYILFIEDIVHGDILTLNSVLLWNKVSEGEVLFLNLFLSTLFEFLIMHIYCFYLFYLIFECQLRLFVY